MGLFPPQLICDLFLEQLISTEALKRTYFHPHPSARMPRTNKATIAFGGWSVSRLLMHASQANQAQTSLFPCYDQQNVFGAPLWHRTDKLSLNRFQYLVVTLENTLLCLFESNFQAWTHNMVECTNMSHLNFTVLDALKFFISPQVVVSLSHLGIILFGSSHAASIGP